MSSLDEQFGLFVPKLKAFFMHLCVLYFYVIKIILLVLVFVKKYSELRTATVL